MKRFLDARKGDIPAAKEQYVNAMRWRREHEIDSILEWWKEPEVMRRYFPTGFVGRDRDGYPLLVERIGNIDFPGMYRAVGEASFLRWVALYHERQEGLLRAATEEAGELRGKMSVIIDLEGLSIGQAQSQTLNVLKKRTTLEEAMYPEVVRTVFLINAPLLFSGVWTIVQYFVDEGTRVKMHIYSAKSATEAALRDRVETKQLPAFLGGELRQPEGDDECSALIGPGGQVHPGYFVGPDPRSAKLTVPAGQSISARFFVEPGSVVRARHAVTRNEMQFRLFVREASAEDVKASGAEPIGPSDGGKAATIVLPCAAAGASKGGSGEKDESGCVWLHAMSGEQAKAAGLPPADGPDGRTSESAKWSDRWTGEVVGAAAKVQAKPSGGWEELAGAGAVLADGHERHSGDWESVVAEKGGEELVGAPVWLDADRRGPAEKLRVKGAGGLGGGSKAEAVFAAGGPVEVLMVWSNDHSWMSDSEAVVRIEVESKEEAAREVGAGHGGGALVEDGEEKKADGSS